ncbi:hypothetical protein ACFLX3_00830 [Chloroflexota bacterium]
MKKRWFLPVTLLILFLILSLTGCGVAQEEVDALLSDLTQAQKELESVKAELSLAQSEVTESKANMEKVVAELEASRAKNSELTSSLDKIQSELETARGESSELTSSLGTLQNEYSSFKSEAQRLFSLLDSSLALNHAILGANAGIMLNSTENTEKGCLNIVSKLASLKDIKLAEFQALWKEAYVTDGGWKLYYEPFDRFMLLHAKRIVGKATALREHLLK